MPFNNRFLIFLQKILHFNAVGSIKCVKKVRFLNGMSVLINRQSSPVFLLTEKIRKYKEATRSKM